MIHTHVLSLIFFGTLSLIGRCVAMEEFNLQNGLSGNFEVPPKDGATCKWVEIRKPGKGPREFKINCNYGCTYKGNPHDCKWYNKNQEQFYKGLAKEAATNQPNACNRNSLEHDQCKGYKFEKQ